nr:uncharacterized protein LOC109159986 [Ipomoea trifida]
MPCLIITTSYASSSSRHVKKEVVALVAPPLQLKKIGTCGVSGVRDSIFSEERIEELNIKRALRFPPAGGHYGHHNNRDKYHVESEYEDDHVQRNKDKYDGNKEKHQDDYGDHNNRNKDKYYENNKLYGGFNVKEKYEDDFSHYENRNDEDTHEKLGLKVKPKWRKAFQYFDGVGHSSNIHYSDDYDEVQSNKSTWSVIANKEN